MPANPDVTRARMIRVSRRREARTNAKERVRAFEQALKRTPSAPVVENERAKALGPTRRPPKQPDRLKQKLERGQRTGRLRLVDPIIVKRGGRLHYAKGTGNLVASPERIALKRLLSKRRTPEDRAMSLTTLQRSNSKKYKLPSDATLKTLASPNKDVRAMAGIVGKKSKAKTEGGGFLSGVMPEKLGPKLAHLAGEGVEAVLKSNKNRPGLTIPGSSADDPVKNFPKGVAGLAKALSSASGNSPGVKAARQQGVVPGYTPWGDKAARAAERGLLSTGSAVIEGLDRPLAATESAIGKGLVAAGAIKGETAKKIKAAKGPGKVFLKGRDWKKDVTGAAITEGLGLGRQAGIVVDLATDPIMYAGLGLAPETGGTSLGLVLQRIRRVAPELLHSEEAQRAFTAYRAHRDDQKLADALRRVASRRNVREAQRQRSVSNIERGLGNKTVVETRFTKRRRLRRDKEIVNRINVPSREALEGVAQAMRSAETRQVRPYVQLRAMTPLGRRIRVRGRDVAVTLPLDLGKLPVGMWSQGAREAEVARNLREVRTRYAAEQGGKLRELDAQIAHVRSLGNSKAVNAKLRRLRGERSKLKKKYDLGLSAAEAEAAAFKAPRVRHLQDAVERRNERTHVIHQARITADEYGRSVQQLFNTAVENALKPIARGKNRERSLTRVQLHAFAEEGAPDLGGNVLADAIKLTPAEQQAADNLRRVYEGMGEHGQKTGILTNLIDRYAGPRIWGKVDDPKSLTDEVKRVSGSTVHSFQQSRHFGGFTELMDPHELARVIKANADRPISDEAAAKLAEQLWATSRDRAFSELVLRNMQRNGPMDYGQLTKTEQAAVNRAAHLGFKRDEQLPLFDTPFTGETEGMVLPRNWDAYGVSRDAYAGLKPEEEKVAKLYSAVKDRQFVRSLREAAKPGSEFEKDLAVLEQRLNDEVLVHDPESYAELERRLTEPARLEAQIADATGRTEERLQLIAARRAAITKELDKLRAGGKARPAKEKVKAADLVADDRALRGADPPDPRNYDDGAAHAEALSEHAATAHERAVEEAHLLDELQAEGVLDAGEPGIFHVQSRFGIDDEMGSTYDRHIFVRRDEHGHPTAAALLDETSQGPRFTTAVMDDGAGMPLHDVVVREELAKSAAAWFNSRKVPTDAQRAKVADLKDLQQQLVEQRRLALEAEKKVLGTPEEGVRARLIELQTGGVKLDGIPEGTVTKELDANGMLWLRGPENHEPLPQLTYAGQRGQNVGRTPDEAGPFDDPFDYAGRISDARSSDNHTLELDPRVLAYTRAKAQGLSSAFAARWFAVDNVRGRSMREFTDLPYEVKATGEVGMANDLRAVRDENGDIVGYVDRVDEDINYFKDELHFPQPTLIPNSAGDIWLDLQSGAEYVRVHDPQHGLADGQFRHLIGQDRLWPTSAVSSFNAELRTAGAFDQIYDAGMNTAWQRVMSITRFGVTTPFPAYHIRNLVSDLLKSMQADSGVLFHPIVNFKLTAAAYGKGLQWKLRVPGMGKMKLEDFLFIADMFGVRTGHHVAEVAALLRSGDKMKAPPKGLTSWFRPGGASTKFGAHREDIVRFQTFMQRLRANGGDAADAAWYMVQHHFNYNDLSAFEKRFMRNLFLFYTWYRKNIPLQLVELARRPGFFAGVAHAYEELEEGGTPMNFGPFSGAAPFQPAVPAYLRDQLQAATMDWNGYAVNVGFGAPWADLSWVSLKGWGQAMTALNPFVVAPVEAALVGAGKRGLDPVTGREYHVREPGGPAELVDKLWQAMGNTALPRDENGNPTLPWALSFALRQLPFFGRATYSLQSVSGVRDQGRLQRYGALAAPFTGLNIYVSPQPGSEREQVAIQKYLGGLASERRHLLEGLSNLPHPEPSSKDFKKSRYGKYVEEQDKQTLKLAKERGLGKDLKNTKNSGYYEGKGRQRKYGLGKGLGSGMKVGLGR